MHSARIMTNTLGVILAGGKSSRMGRDKATLPYRDKRLIDHMAELLYASDIDTVIVSGQVAGFHCIADEIKNTGPMGGIYSVIQTIDPSIFQSSLFIPVDMPRLTPDVLNYLTKSITAYDAICYKHYPLPFALQNTQRIFELITTYFHAKSTNGSIKGLLSNLNTSYQTLDSQLSNTFLNANTPVEWSQQQLE